VILGSAAVPVTYAVGRESVGRRAGLIAAGIMALAPFSVFYGIEARPYAATMFFTILSTLALLRAIRPGSRRGWWMLYTVAAAAAAYSHYTAVFVLAVQAGCSLWLARDRIAEPLLANIAIVALYVPWLPHLRGKALAVIGALYPLSVHRVLTDLLRPVPGHPSAPLSAIPGVLGLIVFTACVLAGLWAWLATGPRARPRAASGHRGDGLGVLVALSLATPVGLLAYSLLFTDLWLPRGLSASVPALALIIGALLAAVPGALVALPVLLVAVVLGVGTVRSFESPYNRGPFRTIAAYLDRVAKPRDPVALISFAGSLAVGEELRRPHLIERRLAAVWRATPPGGEAYVLLDQATQRALHLATPAHPGFVRVLRRVYPGLPTAYLLGFRRLR
jgi:4-amino-4-deoxy-L-arabinose transferase-like glycosyltransferase